MDKLTKGTWLINSTKHLTNTKITTIELNNFEATEQSGKAGILLGRLVADKQEIIKGDVLKVFARQSGIASDSLNTYANYLKKLGKVDYKLDDMGRINELEIYCFSMNDAIETTSDLFEELKPDCNEKAGILTLQSTFELPKSHEELIEELSNEGYKEETLEDVFLLQRTFGLIKSDNINDELTYYNEYAFSDGNIGKIERAIANLKQNDKDSVKYVLDVVMNSQGYPADAFRSEINPDLIKMMEGIGLLDGVTVKSKIGEATFFTTPQIKGQGVGQCNLSYDVFHKAKILLSCLRFGQLKSSYGRGMISSTSKMLNIINKLNRCEWVGPCTAIGQDYQLLEMDGVIVTRPVRSGMFEMQLRQKEVGKLVKQMIEFNRVISEMDDNFVDVLKEQPSSYIIPEIRKKEIEANSTKPIQKYRDKMLTSLRTGGIM